MLFIPVQVLEIFADNLNVQQEGCKVWQELLNHQKVEEELLKCQ